VNGGSLAVDDLQVLAGVNTVLRINDGDGQFSQTINNLAIDEKFTGNIIDSTKSKQPQDIRLRSFAHNGNWIGPVFKLSYHNVLTIDGGRNLVDGMAVCRGAGKYTTGVVLNDCRFGKGTPETFVLRDNSSGLWWCKWTNCRGYYGSPVPDGIETSW
jgi:hypothetical protein